MATFKLACHQITWGRDLDGALNDISEFGYKGTETFAFVIDDFVGREDELIEKIKSKGLQLTALYGGGNMHVAGEEKEVIETNLRIARFLKLAGADRLVLGPGRGRPEPRPSDEEIKTMARVAEEIGKACLDMGMVAGIHPHWGTPVQTREDITRTFDAVDTSIVKMVLDPAHMAKADVDPLEVVQTYKDIITYVHIKDYSPELDTEDAVKPIGQDNAPSLAFFSELGRGIVDTPGFVDELRKADYDGWLTIELDRTQTTPRESLAENTKYLKEVMGFDIGGENH